MPGFAVLALALTADPARALLDRAIEAGGGAHALERAAALAWKGRAQVHLEDRTISIVGAWRLEPPDRAIVETRIDGQDPKTARTLIVSGPRGWMQREGATTRLAPALVEHEREQFYLYSLLRLVPLRSPEFTLEPLPPDAGQAGLRVKRDKRPAVSVYFDRAHRPRRLVSEITDPGTGSRKRQLVTLSGDLAVAGIRWPRQIQISWDGRPYFDLEISDLAVSGELRDERLDPVRVLIAYQSTGGHTAALAQAVEEGARKAGADVTTKKVAEVGCGELLETDALLVGSPVYWSNMAAEVKAFFDRWTTDCNVLPPAFPMKDKVGAAFVTGGEVSSGKEIALMTILAAMLGNRMLVVSEGQSLGATATTGEGKLPLAEGELNEGRRLGERAATVAKALKRQPVR